MSLYGDFSVIPGGDKNSVPIASSSIKLLQDHLRLRNRDKNRNSSGSSRRAASYRPGGSGSVLIESGCLLPAIISDKSTGSLLGGDWDVSNEYDPFHPNDYEKIMRERREEEKRKKAEKEVQIVVTAKKRLVGPYTSDDEDDDDDIHDPKTSNSNPFVTPATKAGAAIAPPKELTECTNPAEPAIIAGNSNISTTAAKIMIKMGYRDGSGLGRDEQGIAKPLMAVKTGVKQGRIQLGSETDEFAAPALPGPSDPANNDKQASESTKKITEMMRNPTRVVLLTNMVGPGEVDDDLEPETKEECSKYGEVAKCVIFEIPGPGVLPEQAVRIFVEFKRIESAIKAVVDLNGRFFAGRTVSASFFDLDRFRNFDLMDTKVDKK